MRVIEYGQKDRTVRLIQEHDDIESLCGWVDSIHCNNFCENCIIEEYIEESKKKFPNGLTYQEAHQFLLDK